MAIRSHTATNVDVQGLFVRMYIVRFWGDVPRSGVSGSYGNSVLLFKGPENCFPKQWQQSVQAYSIYKVPHSLFAGVPPSDGD